MPHPRFRMPRLLLNTIALEPNRWTRDKIAHYDLEDLLAPIAEAGFGALEVWQHHLSRKTGKEVMRLYDRATDLGLSFAVAGLYPVLHQGGLQGYRALEETDRLLDYAQMLRAEVVKIFVGNKASQALSENEYRHSLATVRALLTEARARGIKLAGETHANTLFDSVAATRAFREEVGQEAFRICYQPYDFRSTHAAIADYEALAPAVIHVHLQGRRDDAMVLLEHAEIDYAAFTATLAAQGFDGFLSIEFVQDCVVDHPRDFDLDRVLANAQRDRDYMARVAAEAGMAVTVD